MNSPTLSHKTTISSRSKTALLNGFGGYGNNTNNNNNNNIQPPSSQIARNRALKTTTTTHLPTNHTSQQRFVPQKTSHNHNNENGMLFTPKSTTTDTTIKRPPPHTSVRSSTLHTIAKTTTTSRLHSQTAAKPERPIPSTGLRRPSVATVLRDGTATSASAAATTTSSKQQSQIPDTNQIRKGLAKFSNPMECQRQFQALSSKIQLLEKTVEARDKDVIGLQEQLKKATETGVGYATIVQYFALKLKLDSDLDLTKECEQLKTKVNKLVTKELEHENRVETIINDYKDHIQVELDLRNKLQEELVETKQAHSEFILNLKGAHKNELDDLTRKHSMVEEELSNKIENLESDLKTTSKELSELRKDHEILTNDFNKLEESLTKDKDARVKYLQEKINQLQKDVDSLNSVLEMRLEKIHLLEKDSLLLTEAQNDLITHKDTIKSLNQQLESVNAALDKKREQFEQLIVESENLRQELKRERKERRRMTMKSEQLEYVLNESCASESNMVFNGTSVDNDQVI